MDCTSKDSSRSDLRFSVELGMSGYSRCITFRGGTGKRKHFLF